MKKLLFAACLLLAHVLALAGPQDAANIRITQNLDQSPSTGITTRYLFVPNTAGTTCAVVLSGTTRLPHCYALGSGLTVMNDVISVSQVQTDWNATSGTAQILNKPTFSTIAYSGDWADLLNKPATWAPSPHTHAWTEITGRPTIPTIHRVRATTAADGTYTWTYPTACSAAPVISVTPENTVSGEIINHKVTAVSATSMTVSVSRAVLTLNGLLGLTLPVIQTPTAQVVHLIAICP